MRTIRKVLVANRGEIAVRVMRTCKRMGIATVAVYSDADVNAPFARLADEAVRIGGESSRESYLVAEKILDAAKRVGADAIHPGYGFLSEREAFADACEQSGIKFIGPSAKAIAGMGLKRESKETAKAAGVPVVPGYNEPAQDDATILAAARKIGFPLLVKASAGGGGKGMRVVRADAELVDALGSARREAMSAFANDALILEKYIERPRHVEIQILGDEHGNVVHLFERDCSIQRRHQKVIEESPSPHLPDETRKAMGAAAVALAKAIGYSNAGTVEFIVAPDGAFYFLEVNTRLQVEHAVTEMVVGVDLVEEQIRVARGEPLRFTQNELAQKGAAIEARIYAEDARNGFLPSTGTLLAVDFPKMPNVRIDSGIEQGGEVSVHYDPMLAKLIAWGTSREDARARLASAIADTVILGVTTNCDFLLEALSHPAFVEGRTHTHFLEENQVGGQLDSRAVCLAACAVVLRDAELRIASRAILPTIGAYRNNGEAWTRVALESAGQDVQLEYVRRGTAFAVRITIAGSVTESLARLLHDSAPEAHADVGLHVEIDGVREHVRLATNGPEHFVWTRRAEVRIREKPRFLDVTGEASSGGHLAPMPGKVLKVFVEVGTEVAAGAPLLLLEAMKMEHAVRANASGKVAVVRVKVGDQVQAGDVLVALEG